MVYYHTSGNVKMLRMILMDYRSTSEVSPYEYMKKYMEKCPETIDDTKLSWIADSFLGFHRHKQFLTEIASHLSEELTFDDQDYFMIVFHAVTFQCDPKDMPNIYKCLFNISKPLLDTFTKFLSNNEVLPFISQVARSSYDTNFITTKIIKPLFEWQPYISDMAHSYAEHVKKIESRKLKLPTVPLQMTVLNRKGKETAVSKPSTIYPATPANSIMTKKIKMLSKSSIDKKLKQIHEKNKQKAEQLLKRVKSNDLHHAQVIKKHSQIMDEFETEFKAKPKPSFTVKADSSPVKENAAAVKRINKRVQLEEEQEVKWVQDTVKFCQNTYKVDELIKYDRQESKREMLMDIEKKHLLGQITHEEAVIAKKNLLDKNKKKYEEFLKDQESWNAELEKWRRLEWEKNRKQVEDLCMSEIKLLQAKSELMTKKKEKAEKIKKESEMMLEEALRRKQEELEHRVNMIKEIKILAMIAKKAQVPRIIDLTVTAGLGLLSEMSLAELQERLQAMKIGLNEELETKRQMISDENKAAKQDLEETKLSIKKYMSEKAMSRKKNKSKLSLNSSSSKEINDLKSILQEKRKLRIKLTT